MSQAVCKNGAAAGERIYINGVWRRKARAWKLGAARAPGKAF